VKHRSYSLAECMQLSRIVPRQPPIAVTGTIAVLAMLVATVVTWAACTEADLVVRGPARVRARVAPQLAFASSSGEQVYAPAAGRIARVAVVEGAAVRAGDVLAVLDTATLEHDVARLESALVAARARHSASLRMQELALAQFAAGHSAREADLAQVSGDEARARRRSSAEVAMAQAAVVAAEREQTRTRDLEHDGAASPKDVEQSAARVADARARLAAARVGSSTGRAELVRRQDAAAASEWAVREQELADRIEATRAEVEAAEHVVANARLELERATIRADVTGTVSAVAVGRNDQVQARQGLFTIVPAGGLRVDAAVAAADIAELRVGMRVRIRLDAFDWQRYGTAGGTIAQIAADAEMIGPAGRQVPGYVVRIELDAEHIGRGADRGELKLGMTGMVEVVTGRDNLLALFVGRIRHAVSL
jgi:multidrug resistance efflux pump